MRLKTLLFAAMALAFSTPAFATDSANTTSTYTNTNGSSADSVVIMQSHDGVHTAPINGNDPLPVTTSSSAIAPVPSTALESCRVLKNSPGSLISLSIAQAALSGAVDLIDATTCPSAGAVTPVDFYNISAGGGLSGLVNDKFSTGIVVLCTSAATPFTYTAMNCAFSGRVQ